MNAKKKNAALLSLLPVLLRYLPRLIQGGKKGGKSGGIILILLVVVAVFWLKNGGLEQLKEMTAQRTADEERTEERTTERTSGDRTERRTDGGGDGDIYLPPGSFSEPDPDSRETSERTVPSSKTGSKNSPEPAKTKPSSQGTTVQKPLPQPSRGDVRISRKSSFRDGGWVTGAGEFLKALPDDTDPQGGRHQSFLLRMAEGDTLRVAHNIDVAPRIQGLESGVVVQFRGEFIANDRGGVVHWTHRDDSGRRPGGWIVVGGKKYE